MMLLRWQATSMTRTTHEPNCCLYLFVDQMLIVGEQTPKQMTLQTEGTASKDGRPDLGCEMTSSVFPGDCATTSKGQS